MRSKLAKALASVGGAMTVQLVTSGGSLLIQTLAARSLGTNGYGAYALFFAAIVMITAVQSGWVGDPLTVYDRFAPRIRGALILTIAGTALAGAVAGVIVAVSMGLTGPLGTLLYALLVALWLLNETGRRIFTARMQFWRLAINDCCYLVTTLLTMGIAVTIGIGSSVELVLACMGLGCLASMILARLQLPGKEYRRAPLRGSAIREIAEFSWWRSVQAGIRPGALLVTRILIATLASTGALVGVEAARLLLAPALTFVNGTGWFLLGNFAKAERDGRPMRARQAVWACGLMSAVALVLSLGGIVLVGVLEPIVTGGKFEVDRLALFGWGIYAVCFACTLPLVSLATARKRSRAVFTIRSVESLVGLSVLAILLLVDPDHASLAPYCLGIGGLVSAAMLWRMLRREDPPSGYVRPPTVENAEETATAGVGAAS